MKHFKVHTKNHLTTVTFDRTNSSANIFDREALEELLYHVQAISESDAKTVLFQSAKHGIFIAGADLHSLVAMTPEELDSLVLLGQQIFDLIERLPQRTIAVIDGACVGGGLELALACDYRVASLSHKTKLGLPETQLGILPAWGGSTRLPALIGLHKALPLILTGKLLNSTVAHKKGLVHAICPSEHLTKLAKEYINAPSPTPKHFSLYHNPISSYLIKNRTLKKLYQSTRGHYPALLEATKVVCSNVLLSHQDALTNERKAIVKLSRSKETKELIQIFFQTEAAKKQNIPEVTPTPIHSTAVIGAGVMGSGISYWLSNRGKSVILQDIDDQSIARGIHQIENNYRHAKQRHILTATEAQAGLDRITASSDRLNLQHVDLVLEAAVENLELKKSIFKDLSSRVHKDTILATNTSALPIQNIADVISNPQRLIGIHFFNPVARMKLVEIITTKDTSKETLASTLRFVQSIGKLPIVVKDSPGFVVNRILVPYMLEAGNLFSRGVSAEEIDNAMLEFGMPMGPIRLLDEVGIDVALHVTNTLSEAFPDRIKPPALLQHLIDHDMLGRKKKQGFYLYTGKGKYIPNPATKQFQHNSNRPKDITSHLSNIMSYEAKKCLEEGIAKSAQDIDFAMVMGTGYAPFRGGPLRHADQISLFTSPCYEPKPTS